jgi:hypothetical protein
VAGSKLGDIAVSIPVSDQGAVPPIALVPITTNPLTFQIPTNPVTTSRTVTLNVGLSAANAIGSSSTVTLTVTPPQPTAVVLTPTAVTGGQTVNGTVQLAGSAPASLGIPVSLSSNDLSVTVPPNVTINGSSVTFTATTSGVAQSKTVTITATTGGTSRTATLTVNPPVLATLSFTTANVISGTSATGTVTATGPLSGQMITLGDTSAFTTVPASLTMNGTSATFSVPTLASPAERSISVTATGGGVSKTATFTLLPVIIKSVTFASAAVTAGSQTTGTIRLNVLAPEVIGIELTSSDPGVASIPAQSRVFQAGSDAVIFPVTTAQPLSQSKTVTITAKIQRSNAPPGAGPVVSTATATLTVNP